MIAIVRPKQPRIRLPWAVSPHSSGQTPGLQIIDLGPLGYQDALDTQRARQDQLIAARGRPDGALGAIYLVEHPPLITVTRRPGAAQHVLATADHLRALGVQLHQTDRGGDVTYHGPGQIVAYPVLDLERLNAPSGKPLGLHGYMRLLEQAVIDTLGHYGIRGERDPTATGVWVTTTNAQQPAKIAAMGVRVRKWITTHGLALNVAPDLTHFNLIVPCGLAGRPVTSMKATLGDACPNYHDAKSTLAANLARLIIQRAASAATH
jgi:lipoate-protein ligase B